MYNQNIYQKNKCESASYTEFPNKSAIRQMQAIKYNQNKNVNTKLTATYEERTKSQSKHSAKTPDLIMPLILGMIFSDCNIENDDIFAILIAGILTL